MVQIYTSKKKKKKWCIVDNPISHAYAIHLLDGKTEFMKATGQPTAESSSAASSEDAGMFDFDNLTILLLVEDL